MSHNTQSTHIRRRALNLCARYAFHFDSIFLSTSATFSFICVNTKPYVRFFQFLYERMCQLTEAVNMISVTWSVTINAPNMSLTKVRLASCLSVYARTRNVMEYYRILHQPWKQRKNLCLGGNICVFVITYNHYALNYARLFKSRIDINHLRGTLISRNLAASRDESCLRGQAKLK